MADISKISLMKRNNMSEIKLLDVNKDWKQARPNLKQVDNSMIMSGYQSFKIDNKEIIPTSNSAILKFDLIKNTIKQDVFGKTVSDIGCANMFFGLFAHLNGATDVVGVDLDIDYINMLNQIINHFKFQNVSIKNINATEYKTPADTVFAFAIIHWVYSCTGFLGSLENVVKHFKAITKQCLYIEWIDPSDDCIADMLHHLDYNKEFSVQDYNKENFVRYLNDNFTSVSFVGKTKATREIYRCLV